MTSKTCREAPRAFADAVIEVGHYWKESRIKVMRSYSQLSTIAG